MSRKSNADLKQQLLNELEVVVRAANKQFEVEIKEENWRDYLDRHGLEEPDPIVKTRAGRRQSAGWKQLCVIIAVHIAKKGLENLAKEAPAFRQQAMQDGATDVPEAATISDVLSRIKDLANP